MATPSASVTHEAQVQESSSSSTAQAQQSLQDPTIHDMFTYLEQLIECRFQWTEARAYNRHCYKLGGSLRALCIAPVRPVPALTVAESDASTCTTQQQPLPPLTYPAQFPADVETFNNLTSEQLAALLETYGQAVPETEDERRSAFETFTGCFF